MTTTIQTPGAPQQYWYIQTDYRLYNHGSTKCLQLDNGATYGHLIALDTCRGLNTVWRRATGPGG